MKKFLTLVMALNMCLTPVIGQVLPDGTTVTLLDYSADNRTPVVNIAAPTAKGVSVNRYAQYNVGPDNLILNNTMQDGGLSQLGGYVAGNPNLIKAGKQASIILNEVSSNKITNINGYTEVLGPQAELIIANPNGISVQGGGFINTSKLTLVTGQSNIVDGAVEGFYLSQRGGVAVAGRAAGALSNLGIDSDSPLYISTRYFTSTGDVYAPEINIITGNNKFDYVLKTADSTNVPKLPDEFAVDTAAVGGMYAGRINIIGTEAGFGVRTYGSLVSDLGDITINNNGGVEYKDIKAAAAANITSAGRVQGGEVYSQSGVNMNAGSVSYELIKTLGGVNMNVAGNVSGENTLAQQDINITAGSVDYDTMKTSGSINITAADYVSHHVNAEAMGDININAAVLNVFTPDAGNPDNVMLSYNDINLNAGTINNEGEIAAFNNINIMPGYLNNSGLLLANNTLNITGGDTFNTGSLFANAGININTDGTLHNKGYIYGFGDINIAGQTGARAAMLLNEGGYIASDGGDVSIKADELKNISIDNCDPETEKCYDKVKTFNAPRQMNQWIVEYVDEMTSLLNAVRQGEIYASNDILLDADTILNSSSIISAGNNLVIDAVTLYNIRSYFYIDRVKEYLAQDYRHCIHRIYGCQWVTRTRYEEVHENYRVRSNTIPVLSGRTVTINALEDIHNESYIEEEGLDISWEASPSNPKIKDATDTGIIDPLGNDFSLGGLFSRTGPDSQYLYITSNRFINMHDFVGSDYFASLMGIRSDKDSAKWLGDPYYEQKLIEQAIAQMTGNRYIFDGIADSNAQMTRLYDNAFDAYNNMGLEIGKALTAEQIAALPDNIIWYVEQEIDGQRVLVPTLYIAQQNRDKFLSDIANGIIKGDVVDINAGNIFNSGVIEGGVAHLYASGNIKNISGQIRAKDSLDIEAGGSIINETHVNRAESRKQTTKTLFNGKIVQTGSSDVVSESLGPEAGITSGGNMKLKAGEDIISSAAVIKSGGDMELDVGRDITIGAKKLTDGVILVEDRDGKTSDYTVTNYGSTVESGGNIKMTSGGDTTVQASQVKAAGDLDIQAENINILSAQDESHYYWYEEDSGFMSSSVDEVRRDKTWQVGSGLSAGGNMNLTAQNDITILASGLETGGNMLLDAANNINILAGINTEASLDRHEETNWFGLTGSGDTVYDNIITLEASSAFSGKNITMKSGEDITIFASDVGAQGDGNIETGGNFNMLAGIESAYHYEEHWERSFDPLKTLTSAFSSLYEGFIDPVGKTKEVTETGRVELFNVSLYNETKDITQTYDETARGSTLNFGGKLTIDAQEDVNIKGSQVYAGESIDISAENINITAQEVKSTFHNEHEEKDVSLTAGVSNAYLNTALAVLEVVNATEALHKAEQQYQDIKRLFDEGKASQQALDDAKENIVMASANLALVTTAATMAAIGAAGSASNSMGTGMQVDVGLSASIDKSEFDSTALMQQGSTLWSGGDITLNARKDIKQEGSALISGEINEEGFLVGGGDINYIAGGNVDIIAAANMYKERSSSSHEDANIGVNSGGTLNIGYGQSKSGSNSSDLWWSNSQALTGDGTISITSGGDTTVKGANIQGSDVVWDIGGALTAESLQDEHHSSNSSKGFNVGLSVSGISALHVPALGSPMSKPGVGPSAGYNRGKGSSDAAWVNNQTTIIGTNSVDITADTTHVKGAVIANITEGGTDGGNLAINTNSFTYEDIHDYSNSYESGWGIQTNLPIDLSGEGGALGIAKDSILHPKGSTKITNKRKGQEKEQETRATIGEGTITIDGEEQGEDSVLLASLNRDIEAAQEVTRDQVTAASDYSVTIDHEIAVKVVEIAGKYGYKLTAGVAKGIAKVLSRQNKDAASGVSNTGAREEYHKDYNTIAHYDEDGKLISTTTITLTQNEDGTFTLKYTMSDDSADNLTAAGIANASSSMTICMEGGYCLPTFFGEKEISNLNIYDTVMMAMLPPDVLKLVGDTIVKSADETRTGLLLIQEGWWDSIPGQTVAGTFGVIGENVGFALDSILWGGLQLGKQAGIFANINTDYELNLFTNPLGQIYQSTIGQLPYERQQDLGLVMDGLMVFGLTKNVASGVLQGGSYSAVRFANVGGEVHHLIPKSLLPEIGLSSGKGPSIWMTATDHAMTGSYKRGLLQDAYRTEMANLLQEGANRSALTTDILNIRSNFGTKYNQGLLQSIEYSKTLPQFQKPTPNINIGGGK